VAVARLEVVTASGVGGGGATPATVIDNAFVVMTGVGELSFNVSRTAYVPASVGVPAIDEQPAQSASPDGSPVAVHEYGRTPFKADSPNTYAVPTTPGDSADVRIVNGGGT
jgi:hypothetical protein